MSPDNSKQACEVSALVATVLRFGGRIQTMMGIQVFKAGESVSNPG
jgi:hypothetical protein